MGSENNLIKVIFTAF